MKLLLLCIAIVFQFNCFAQYSSSLSEGQWVDSVFHSLSKKKRIAQLMIIRAHSNLGSEHVEGVTKLIKKYGVGGLCFFQGGPVRQANLTNYYQSIARTPLLMTIDAEWGLGMRLDSVINFPRQMMLGADEDGRLVYKVGKAIGAQCKRMGIHMNFAPVADVNNNPDNPVINDRSFGENKYKVAAFAIEYMKGMRDEGVMSSAKHFPGHGDVNVDSHFDLPVINKTKQQLDSLELYPFVEMIKEGVPGIMAAHLYIPAIDSTTNLATSLSNNAITGLLKNELNFDGLTITDGLEMKGVTKYFPSGEIGLQSLKAGNDLLLLPQDVPGCIKKIRKGIRKHLLDKAAFEKSVKKVLLAKYHAGLPNLMPLTTIGLIDSLNAQTKVLRREVAEHSITLLKSKQNDVLPLTPKQRIAYVGIGIDSANAFAKKIKQEYNATAICFGYKKDAAAAEIVLKQLVNKFDVVLIGVHNYSRRPANRFGISSAAYQLIYNIQSAYPSVTLVFGNPYAIKQFDASATNLFACYEDDEITQLTAVDMLSGLMTAKGKLPISINNELKAGSGIINYRFFPYVKPENTRLKPEVLQEIDSLANDAIAQHATPGCVVLVAKDGKVAFHKAYGYTNYDRQQPTTPDMVYDLASVTKTSATTVAIMKLYEEGKLDLDKKLGDYLPWTKGSDKEHLLIKNVLLHQAGLVGWIPFYKETLDKSGYPLPAIYRNEPSDSFSTIVAKGLYIRNNWRDTILSRILQSKLGPSDKYEYSDNDFIFLGLIVEAITGQRLEAYVEQTFYKPLQMSTTTFRPRNVIPLDMIAPTERDKNFRQQLLRGDVHDPAAAMLGGVAGHAGLYSNAYDLAQLYQMLLNGGEMNGIRYLKKETIDKFTGYSSDVSRRGLGFDKPEKDNETRPDPYPARCVSLQTFGHTGFTGICVWADPANNLLYIFLSNRVTPDAENNKLLKMKVRANIQEAIYNALSM